MWLNYNPIKPEAEFYSRGSDARLPFLNYNPIKPEAEFYSRGTDARLPSLRASPSSLHCAPLLLFSNGFFIVCCYASSAKGKTGR